MRGNGGWVRRGEVGARHKLGCGCDMEEEGRREGRKRCSHAQKSLPRVSESKLFE